MSDVIRNKKLYWLSLFICTICICIPAFINNFPFIYSDTGSYMDIGFSNRVSHIRPLTYGLFIRHISLYESLWLVIFAQSFIVVWFIHLFVKTFFKNIPSFFILLVVAILTATTSIGVSTGMLMPDFTTPILILASAVLLFSKIKSKRVFLFTCLGLWFSIACHHSHAYIFFLILIGIGLKRLFFRNSITLYNDKRLILLFFLLLLGHFTIPALHYSRNGKFISNQSANVFLMGRINQMGLLKPFLEDRCPEVYYPICKYKDSIPRSFLWDKNSPVRKEGTWKINNKVYQETIHDFLLEPHYLKKFAVKSFETGVQQFFSFNTVRLDPLKRNKWPQDTFERHMPDVVPALEQSAQNRKTWSNVTIDFMQYIIVFTSAIIMIYLLFYQTHYPIHPIYRNLAFLFVLGLISNAFICGGISMIAPRFQSRIIWVLPLFALCLSYHIWTSNHKKQNHLR